MSTLMFQMANSMMNVMSNNPLLNNANQSGGTEKNKWAWVSEVADSINSLLWPILILVGTAGVIYAVYLGVNLARADSSDKQQEAKKRMINAIIGLVSIVALILLLKLFMTYIPEWIGVEKTGDLEF